MIPYKTDTDISSYIIFPRFLIPMDLSNDAKVLYALLLDRAGISKKKGTSKRMEPSACTSLWRTLNRNSDGAGRWQCGRFTNWNPAA